MGNWKSREFPEVTRLKMLRDKYSINVTLRDGDLPGKGKKYKGVELHIKDNIFNIFVSDEYKDLDSRNQLLCLNLVLRELELYEEAEDYLAWCGFSNLDPSDGQVREYHMDLRLIYRDVEHLLGGIDSCISDLDFELNSGAAQWLREFGKSL
jgi:hypothetical protein